MRFLPPDEPLNLVKTQLDNAYLGVRKSARRYLMLERIEDPLVVALADDGAQESHIF